MTSTGVALRLYLCNGLPDTVTLSCKSCHAVTVMCDITIHSVGDNTHSHQVIGCGIETFS